MSANVLARVLPMFTLGFRTILSSRHWYRRTTACMQGHWQPIHLACPWYLYALPGSDSVETALGLYTAHDVAQAFTNVFSHFGFPQEILSDHGFDFMSALMQIFWSLELIWSVPVRTIHRRTGPVNVLTAPWSRCCVHWLLSSPIRGTLLCRGFFSPTANCQWRHMTAVLVICSLEFGRSVAGPSSSRHGYKRPTIAAPSSTIPSLVTIGPGVQSYGGSYFGLLYENGLSPITL